MKKPSILDSEVINSIKKLNDTELIEQIANKLDFNEMYVEVLLTEAKSRNIDQTEIDKKTEEVNITIEEKLKVGKSANSILIGLGLFTALLLFLGILNGFQIIIFPGWGVFLYYGWKLKNAKEIGPYSKTPLFRYNDKARGYGTTLIVISFVILMIILLNRTSSM
jgi:hypothetical protein